MYVHTLKIKKQQETRKPIGGLFYFVLFLIFKGHSKKIKTRMSKQQFAFGQLL